MPRYNKLHQYALRQGRCKRGCRRDADSTTAKWHRRRHSRPGRKRPERWEAQSGGNSKRPALRTGGPMRPTYRKHPPAAICSRCCSSDFPLSRGYWLGFIWPSLYAHASGLSRVPPERQPSQGMTPMAAAFPSKRLGVPLPGGLWSTLGVGVLVIGWPSVHPGGSLQRRSRLPRSNNHNIILPIAQLGSESPARGSRQANLPGMTSCQARAMIGPTGPGR